ncbi:MAG: hypothetical protein ABIA92_03440, partial [Patescibacteria group bacterium]
HRIGKETMGILIDLPLGSCLCFKMAKAKEKGDNHMEQKSLTAAMLNKYLYETEDAEELLEELLKIAERIFEDTRYSISKLLSAA